MKFPIERNNKHAYKVMSFKKQAVLCVHLLCFNRHRGAMKRRASAGKEGLLSSAHWEEADVRVMFVSIVSFHCGEVSLS